MDVTHLFDAEVARLKVAGVAGKTGRLADLFDYLADRGPEADSASQEEIALHVFGQAETNADDATVRVYVHRLRKKIDDFYATSGDADDAPRIELPSGIYALRLQPAENGEAVPPAAPVWRNPWHVRVVVGAVALLLVAALVLALFMPTARNAVWQPLTDSDRPVLLVLGDYYIYGEIDPVRPEQSRLIRDFRVDSEADLSALQEAEPERYGFAEDVGLTYLPLASAYAMQHVAPLLADAGKDVTVIASSELEPDMLNRYDVVYVGLLSGMGLLEEGVFAGSSVRPGESYDEIVDRHTRQTWTSDEARTLASPAFYRDYAYVSAFEARTGAQVVVIASERETGLRGVSPIVTADSLPGDWTVSGDAFEALVQVTGQQGADLDDRLIFARPR